ncbi:MAG: response regulator transcription factor [Fibrobacterales bacterium]|nr:response regulator transcription factor [Fibrobacterales bacterium]
MAKVLIVDDEESILVGLKDNFELEGYDVEVARDGEEALAKVDEFGPDLVLLDLMLPKKNGFEICRSVRRSRPGTYVIILTAKTDESSKVAGLEIGADDYVTKPFSILELLARAKSALRRQAEARAQAPEEVFRRGDVFLDFKRYVAKKGDEELQLSSREFQIMKYFVSRRGEVVLREDLLENVWRCDPDAFPTTRTVDNHIVKLRQKLEDNPSEPKLILSIRGAGYKLDA